VALQVAHVDAPELVPATRREGHLPLLLGRPLGLLQAVEGAVGGEDATAGPGAQVDADLGQGRVDPVLAEVRVPLQPPHGLHRPERDLPHAGRAAVGPILEAVGAFLRPPPQDAVDGRLMDAQVAGYGLGAPALGVEGHHGQPALAALRDLVVGREAPHHAQGDRFLRQDAPDALVVRAPSEEDVAGVGDLVEVEARVLGLEIHDEATNGRRQPPVLGPLGTEEALHAFRMEAGRPPLEGPLGGRAGLLRAPGREATEQHQGPDEFVVPLLRLPAQELDLFPLFGRLDAAPTSAPRTAHLRPPSPHCPRRPAPSCAGREACHKACITASRRPVGAKPERATYPTAQVLLWVADIVAGFLPTQEINPLVQDGSIGQTMESLLGKLQPEAAYFGPIEGKRGGFIVINMEQESEVVTKLEPLWQELGATIETYPVATADELSRGLQSL
jgi:hypothetical protein